MLYNCVDVTQQKLNYRPTEEKKKQISCQDINFLQLPVLCSVTQPFKIWGALPKKFNSNFQTLKNNPSFNHKFDLWGSTCGPRRSGWASLIDMVMHRKQVPNKQTNKRQFGTSSC